MNILAVDGNAARLAKTAALLRSVFPKAAVVAQDDALMAGKYAFSRPVDVLFAALDMKRMDGLQMADFVRKQHPGIWVFLTACPAQYSASTAFEAEADGFLSEPLCAAELHRAMTKAEQNRSEKTGNIERIAHITPERTEKQ